MTTIPALFADLRRRAICITVHGDKIRLEAPAGAITPELRTEVIQHKTEILTALTNVESSEYVTEITETCSENAEEPVSMISMTPSVVQQNESATSSNPAVSLHDLYHQRIHRARDWKDLWSILTDSQLAYVAGDLASEAVEDLAALCAQEAKHLPEHASANPINTEDSLPPEIES